MASHSEQMLQALANEDLVSAQLALNEAIQHDDVNYLAELGEELLGMGFLQEAQQIFTTLLERQPQQVVYNLPLAEIAIEENQIEEAFTYLEAIPADSEYYPQALLVLADLYQVLDIPEVSLAKLEEAAQLLPNEPLIQFALAELYFVMNQFGEAAQRYAHLLNAGVTEMSNVSMNERLGSSLSMAGQFEEAITYLEAALTEEHTDDRLFQTAFVYLQLGERQKAIHYLQELRTLNPQYQTLYLYLAESLQAEEQIQEAQQVIEEGIHENPYQVEFYHFAAENSYRMHDMPKAEKFLVQALELGEKEEETLLTLSNLYLKEEFYEEAIQAIQKMEDQDSPHAQWNLAQAYNALEEFDHASKHFAQAAEGLLHDAAFLRDYGLFLREEGQLAQAREMFTQYLVLEPGDLEIQTLLEDANY